MVLISPENRQSIEPGGAVVLEEASYDADNDLTVREWRRWAPELSEPEVLSTRSMETLTGLFPGEYHLSLYVEDARGIPPSNTSTSPCNRAFPRSTETHWC